jgi:hypothetical protein
MPEIWLPYGSVEVVVSIKAENLADQLEPNLPSLGEETLAESLGKIEVKERTCLFMPRPSRASIDVMTKLIKTLTDKGVTPSTVTVATPKEYAIYLRKPLLESKVNIAEIGEPSELIGSIDKVEVKIPRVLKECETPVLISDTGFDPLFGFAGGPTALVRYLKNGLMAEAFRRRKGDRPAPGVSSDSSAFADQVAELLGEAVSVEILPGCNGGVSSVYVDNPVAAHQAASQGVLDSSRVSVKSDFKVAMVSAGGTGFDSTLADSLRAVWNVVDALGDKGVVALIAECSRSLGSEALKRHITGRLDLQDSVRHGEYIDGLEDLLYAKTALRRYTLVLVSALPDYYAEMKLGFHPCRKTGDALSYILSSLGSRTKVHLVPYGSATLLSKE